MCLNLFPVDFEEIPIHFINNNVEFSSIISNLLTHTKIISKLLVTHVVKFGLGES